VAEPISMRPDGVGSGAAAGSARRAAKSSARRLGGVGIATRPAAQNSS
jgi:hypothetical protein